MRSCVKLNRRSYYAQCPFRLLSAAVDKNVQTNEEGGAGEAASENEAGGEALQSGQGADAVTNAANENNISTETMSIEGVQKYERGDEVGQ